jgi:hypothetical protein
VAGLYTVPRLVLAPAVAPPPIQCSMVATSGALSRGSRAGRA